MNGDFRITLEKNVDGQVLRVQSTISDYALSECGNNPYELLDISFRYLYKQLEVELNKVNLRKELNREYCDY